MSFDALVTNPGRLQILTALAAVGPQEFVQLRHATRLTDGNLASHARRLQQAGLIAVQKEFRGGKPVTRFTLNTEGRAALESHANELLKAMGSVTTMYPQISNVRVSSSVLASDDEWID